MPHTAIKIQHFNKSFEFESSVKQVIYDLSLKVSLGEVFGFLGPNGAGKSTTIKSLLGFLKIDSGTFEVCGELVGTSEFRQYVGYLPELPFFYDHLTASETLTLSGQLSGVSKSMLNNRVPDLLERMNLGYATRQKVGGFSKGMKQRLGMANAMIHDPDILIFDEPMSGLDPIGRYQIKDLIKELQQEGKTIFFSSHILSDIEELCDRIALIHRGRLLYTGDLNHFLDADKNLEQSFVQAVQEADNDISL